MQKTEVSDVEQEIEKRRKDEKELKQRGKLKEV